MNTIRKFNLVPTDGRKSFYGKAKVEVKQDKDGNVTMELRSYDTHVATFHGSSGTVDVYGWYSTTTARHINALLVELGFNKMSKKEMKALESK